MNRSPEQLISPTEQLTEELLVKADELQRLHNLGMLSVGDTKLFRPSPELRAKMAETRQEGAKILRELKSLLDARGLQHLELFIADKWGVQQFDKENNEQ